MSKNNNPFALSEIKKISYKTPFFIFNKQQLLENLEQYKKLFPSNTEICYSIKANAEKPVIETLHHAGTGFELASKYELRMLKPFHISARKIVYGSSVKSADHIKEFVKYGVERFAADSEPELLKIALYAPRAKVYIRMLVDDQSQSVFHMSEKFGVPVKETIRLLIKAKELGLQTYGISFNVGSQARNSQAWARGIREVATVMKELAKQHITVDIINLGGGFPHQYEYKEKIPTLNEIVKNIQEAIKTLPYRVDYIIEPGRGLVANTYVLVTGVTEKIMRHNGNWLHIDAGVYNALLEAMAYQGSIRYKISPLKHYFSSETNIFILTGPACDDLDVVEEDAVLPSAIKVNDKLVIFDTGAYTFTLMTRFNGYPKPKTIIK